MSVSADAGTKAVTYADEQHWIESEVNDEEARCGNRFGNIEIPVAPKGLGDPVDSETASDAARRQSAEKGAFGRRGLEGDSQNGDQTDPGEPVQVCRGKTETV